MLDTWLGPTSVPEFVASYLGQRPLAVAGVAGSAMSFDWTALGRLLPHAQDALVVAAGDLVRRPAPRTLGQLVENFRIGAGIALRKTERLDPCLTEIHGWFERALGPTHVQLFATPGGTHGFGWHFDDEDVFVVQTVGIKDYYFRENTVTMETAAPAQFARFPEETAPLCTATLAPGDFLYLPAKWWHMAVAREHALSISVGCWTRQNERA